MKKKTIHAVLFLVVLLAIVLSVRCPRFREEPNPRTTTLMLTGTEGAAFSGYFLRQGKRIDVTGDLPATFTESGLTECEFRKANSGDSLTLEARDGVSYLQFTAPAGVPGVKAKLTGGWNVVQAN